MALKPFDVTIVGAGPAGSACAAFCAQSGLKTLVIEKAVFPRDKVCGDCLNPACWPILERLGIAKRLLLLPHAKLAEVRFIGFGGQRIPFPLHVSERGAIAVRRAHFDQLLLERARECGAEVRENATLTGLENGWKIRTNSEEFAGRFLIAADGRNSTVARMLGLLPPASRERVALQTHAVAPRDFGESVELRWAPEGYCGIASIGADRLNICLVARPPNLAALKARAASWFALGDDAEWRTITPLARRAVSPLHKNLLLIGDAARVVEPFTGEGIYYALASGELAARHLSGELPLADYPRNHTRLYAGRLWVNQLAKAAVLSPRLGNSLLWLLRREPRLLRFLTAKVLGSALTSAPTRV